LALRRKYLKNSTGVIIRYDWSGGNPLINKEVSPTNLRLDKTEVVCYIEVVEFGKIRSRKRLRTMEWQSEL
jgi:hypothetical protein